MDDHNECVGPMERAQFVDEFRSLYSSSGLTLEAVAVLLKTSPLTVSRWFDGISTPNMLGRRPILDALAKAGAS